MGENTRIEWADHTFNPWTGCQAVSPACDHCYAEATAKRAPSTFGGWGPGAERKRTSESYWRQPLLWNKRAAKEGRRARVFCASMADVFDNAVQPAWRCDLWDLIAETPALDWLLLTKRPQNIAGMLPQRSHGALMGWGPVGYANVWLGTTVENQEEADRRIPHLLAVPAAKRFLSCEPLLGPVDLTVDGLSCGPCPHCSEGQYWEPDTNANGCPHCDGLGKGEELLIDWVIAGGESGPHARPSHPDWFRSLRDQCQAADVPFFFKQWGEWMSQNAGDPDIPLGGHPSHDVHDANGAVADGMFRVGKKAAGAALDGREWREVPHG